MLEGDEEVSSEACVEREADEQVVTIGIASDVACVEIGIASISNGDGESVEMNMKSIPMHYLQIREVQVSTAFRSLSS